MRLLIAGLLVRVQSGEQNRRSERSVSAGIDRDPHFTHTFAPTCRFRDRSLRPQQEQLGDRLAHPVGRDDAGVEYVPVVDPTAPGVAPPDARAARARGGAAAAAPSWSASTPPRARTGWW